MARSLLFIELGSRPSKDVRRGFPSEGFKLDIAAGISHAQNMISMRAYSGCVIFGTSLPLLLRCLTVLEQQTVADVIPLLCIADLSEDEQIEALERGASRCLPSSVSFREMLAQIRALFDVVEGFPVHYRIRDLGIDPVARRASRAGQPLDLRPKEFDLLLYFAERYERTVSWEELHRQFWPRREFSSSRIAVQIHNLRRAIGISRKAPLLHTVRGDGYRLSDTVPTRSIASAS